MTTVCVAALRFHAKSGFLGVSDVTSAASSHITASTLAMTRT